MELRSYLPEKGKVLDIGAGRGISSYAFAKDGWQVTALEPDPSDLVGSGAIRKLFQAAGLEGKVIGSKGEKLPFESGFFDVVYLRQALHHADDLPGFCREVARVLKSGGTFIATREHVLSKKEDLPRFLENHPLHRLYGGEKAYLLSEYLEALENAGIRIKKKLNPLESEINLFPESISGLKKKRPILRFFPDFLFPLAGNFLSIPGRLYSFIGIKRHE